MCTYATLNSQAVYSSANSQSLPGLTNSVVFELDDEAILKRTYQAKSSRWVLELPFYDHEVVELELEEMQIHSNDLTVNIVTEGVRKNYNYVPGKYFRGRVLNMPNSSVVLSVHEGEIAGTVTTNHGDYNIGKLANSDKYVLYKAEDLEEVIDIPCEMIMDEESNDSDEELSTKRMGCTTEVDIFVECDYQMYQNFNNNVTSVTNYVNTLFGRVATLYSYESITIRVSQIDVWTSNDNYPSGTSALTNFASSKNSSGFNGDLAILLTNDTGANGGVAYVNQLCGGNPYSYADIINSSQAYPTYSWDVQVVTHELGHNFGSQHTHSCVWGPNNNEQIDDCGNVALGGGGTCYDPANKIIPTGGGTIMSYCHVNTVGINFSYGFGAEPGNLIRAKHSACFCDNSTCNTATEITASGTYSAQPNSGNGASNRNASHADWFLFRPLTNGTIDIESCNEGMDTRVWVHSGTCSSMTFEVLSDDDCTSSGRSSYASEITSFQVVAGRTYYIEWDDRWSSAAFDWRFTFSSSGGGLPPCDGMHLNVSGQVTDNDYRAKMELESDGMIQNNIDPMFTAGNGIELSPGFEIKVGSSLTANIEDCIN